MTNPIEWTIDVPSLEAFKRGLGTGDSQPEWFRLRPEAEELALRPAFDRLITLDHKHHGATASDQGRRTGSVAAHGGAGAGVCGRCVTRRSARSRGACWYRLGGSRIWE